MIIFYYKCENCGQMYYSAAELSGTQLTCEKCGSVIKKVDPAELRKGEERKDKDSKVKGGRNL
ncbi:MAG: hypothetical protein ACPLEW_11060 [Pseudothermotoga sp.]